MTERDKVDPERRDFLISATAILGAAGAAGACWPFISSMNPTGAVKSEAVTEVGLQGIAAGSVNTVA